MPPLVLLPGMMCDARLFSPQIAALSGSTTLHCAPIGGAETMAELAAEVLRHAPPRFALAGLSMGGIVAMEMIRQAPDRVDRLCLMDTNALAETPGVAARREPQIAKALAGELKSVMRDEMKPNYLTDGPRRMQILDLCLDMALGLGAEVFARQSRALRDRPDQSDTLRAVAVPSLVLMGEDDRLCPRDRHTLMADLIPGATLTVVPDAGHLPCLEQPDATTAALLRWLKG